MTGITNKLKPADAKEVFSPGQKLLGLTGYLRARVFQVQRANCTSGSVGYGMRREKSNSEGAGECWVRERTTSEMVLASSGMLVAISGMLLAPSGMVLASSEM